jgi:hypothetical protein
MLAEEEFRKFLETIDLPRYREQYSRVKTVEMDLPKLIQAIELLYRVYWNERSFLAFEDFYKRYQAEKGELLEEFRQRTTLCQDCFARGIEARIYRTWTALLTQIHAGYVAELVFGPGTVEMSAELDSLGADIRVHYKGHYLNYQVKKTSHSGVKSGRPLPRKNILPGEAIDILYEVPQSLSDPKKKNGKLREPYRRFQEDRRTTHLKNFFVIFTPYAFEGKKTELDNVPTEVVTQSESRAETPVPSAHSQD